MSYFGVVETRYKKRWKPEKVVMDHNVIIVVHFLYKNMCEKMKRTLCGQLF